jgi:hypothetical protein
MSNHFGLMLSFIFLSFFIVLSGEILAYQQTTSKTLSLTTQVALHIEKNGYDENVVNEFSYISYFDDLTVIKVDDEDLNGYHRYDIIGYKKYNSFSNIYDYFNQDIVCKMSVYRKEYENG